MTSRLPNADPPLAPLWFRSPHERKADAVEFESADVETSTSTVPEVHVSEQWSRAKTTTAADSEPLRSPAAPGRIGIRARDVMLGAAVATLLFGVFSVGFLSRGLVGTEPDEQLLAMLERAVEAQATEQAPTVRAAVPVANRSVKTPADDNVPEETAPKPASEALVADAAGAAAPVTVPQLKLNDPLAHSFAKPRSGSLKLIAGPTTLNTAGSGEPQCESGQCTMPPGGPVQGEHGTKIAWADSQDEAQQLARTQDKLVFMMHVSGNFEKPGFT